MRRDTNKNDYSFEILLAVLGIIIVFLIALCIAFSSSAQEVERGEIYLESDRGVIFIRNAGAGNEFARSLTLQPDRDYEMLLYIHNAADAELSNDGYAEGVHFTLSAPDTIKGGSDAEISALLTANNTIPAITGSTVKLTATKTLSITFRDENGELYSARRCDGDLKFQEFVDMVGFSLDGKITLSGGIGDLPPGGGAEAFSVIFFQFRTEAVVTDYSNVWKIMLGCIALAVIVAFGAITLSKR